MPLYAYQVVREDGQPGEVFEVLQKMSEPALTHHPETGEPVVKLISAPNAMRVASPGNLNNSRLESLGFTKYQRAGGGMYEKTAGKGPNVIGAD